MIWLGGYLLSGWMVIEIILLMTRDRAIRAARWRGTLYASCETPGEKIAFHIHVTAPRVFAAGRILILWPIYVLHAIRTALK